MLKLRSFIADKSVFIKNNWGNILVKLSSQNTFKKVIKMLIFVLKLKKSIKKL